MLMRSTHAGWRHAKRVTRRVRRLPSVTAAAAAAVVAGLSGQAATWDHAHGDATNSGFADVATLPAVRPLATVPGIGSYAPGAGPVIGPDGTVYLGNEQGELRALHPDGSLAWKRTLGPPAGQAILASPVVDTDGSIYVVGVRTYTDHRVTPAVKRSESRLHRFTAGGGYLWDKLFPGDTATTAPPNIWRSGADIAILVPAAYRGVASKDVHLLAYTTGGALLANKLIGAIVPQTFGGNGLPEFWNIGCGLTLIGCLVPPIQFCPSDFVPADPADRLPTGISAPMPGVAIFTFAGGGTPWIIATDQASTSVGWTFAMAGGFTERFRKSRDGLVTSSAPMVLPDAHSVVGTGEQKYDDTCGGHFVGTGGHVTFSGPNATVLSDVPIDYPVIVTPARTGDGRIIVAHNYGFDVLRGSTWLHQVQYTGQTIAPAAVSRTHIYVSTTSSLRTYDVNTLAQAGEVDWLGGGLSSPAIGPSGRVYALASNTLFIWSGPLCPPVGCIVVNGGGMFSVRSELETLLRRSSPPPTSRTPQL